MWRTVLCSCLLGLVGCGGADGAAPVISNLTYSPMTVPVGQLTTIMGSFDFTDPDGDTSDIDISVMQGGQTQKLAAAKIQNSAGIKMGKLQVAVALLAPTAGAAQFAVTVVDEAGHTSNALTGSVTAQ